ncbi:hypothetical protein F5141DRAFT_1067739 [Pisolithus sp. B1]|nr:hypothetical protein F5141DRAFT_1067739 [Pisolithus sp. B1]
MTATGSLVNALTCTLHVGAMTGSGSLLNALTCTLHVGAMTGSGSLLNALTCTLHVGAMTASGSLLNALTCTLHVGAMTGSGSLLNALTCTLHVGAMTGSLQNLITIIHGILDLTYSLTGAYVTLLGKFPTVQSIAEHAIGNSLSLLAHHSLTLEGCLLVAEQSYFLMQHKDHVWKEVLSLAVEAYETSNMQVSVSKDVKAVFHDYSGDMDGLCDGIMQVIVENCMSNKLLIESGTK